MIFLDANVFMYAAGTAHPHKGPSAELLRRVAAGALPATTSAEVLQELLHRYRALNRWPDGRQVFLLARRVVPAIEPITAGILDASLLLLDRYPTLMARDGLHAATCLQQHGLVMCSYDVDFDVVAELRRQTPEQVLAAG